MNQENATDATDALIEPIDRSDAMPDRDDSVASVDRSAASLSSSGVAAEEVARAAAQAAFDKKAEDVVVLDLTELSDVCDFFMIATGFNNRQVDTIVDEIEEQVAKACGEHPFSIWRATGPAGGFSWTTARLSFMCLLLRHASTIGSRSSGEMLRSFRSTWSKSALGTHVCP